MTTKKHKYDYMMDGDMMGYSTGGDILKYSSAITPIVTAINPIAGLVWGASTGIGSAVVGGIDANNEEEKRLLDEKNAARRMSFQGDPRYQRLANGGSIINDMPTTNAGTDTIPVDANGSPVVNNKSKGVAMVDSGEVIKDGYVFSNVIKIGKKTIADKAKDIMRKYKNRLGDNLDGVDKISKEQMDRDFADLADEQERYKEENNIQETSVGYVSGGKIAINSDKRGIFTSAAERRGMGIQEFASHVIANKEKYSEQMVKKANFAKNSSKLNHKALGGYEEDPIPGFNNPYSSSVFPIKTNSLGVTDDTKISNGTQIELNGGFDYQDNSMLEQNIEIPKTSTDWSNIAGVGSQALTLGLRAFNIAKNSKNSRPSSYGYVPKDVSLAESRNDLSREADIQRTQARRLFGDNRAAQIAAGTAIDRSLFTALNDSTIKEKTENAYNQNRASAFNAQSRMQADEVSARESSSMAMAYDSLLQDTSGIASGFIKDKNTKQMDELRFKLLQDMYRDYTITGVMPEELKTVLRSNKQ